MTENRQHKTFLRFVSRLVDLATLYSKENLFKFLDISSKEFPALTGIIHEYIRLAEKADTDIECKSRPSTFARSFAYLETTKLGNSKLEMHLFDLLRSKKLFATNADLAEFAQRILPKMAPRRFDKMSRGDIAARIIVYLEGRKPEKRQRLERAMREALVLLSSPSRKKTSKRTFFQQWEKIIKGTEF